MKYWLTIFFMGFLMSGLSQQSSGNAEKEFMALDEMYLDNQLDDEEYLKSVDSLFWKNVKSGNYFKTRELYKHLSLYEKIAWSDSKFAKSKVKYFYLLLNNAEFQGLGGEAIFFANKIEEITNGRQSLISSFTKCSFYLKNKNYVKARQEYEEVKDVLFSVAADVKDEDDRMSILGSINMAGIMMGAFTALEDSSGIIEVMALAKYLLTAINSTNNFSQHDSILAHTIYKALQFGQYHYFKDFPRAKQALDYIATNFTDSTKNRDLNIQFTQYQLYRSYAMYYLAIGKADSAALYIRNFEKMPALFNDFSYDVNKLKLELAELEGDYKEGFKLALNSIKDIEHIQSTLLNEIDNLLYAHTEADFNQKELVKSEILQKKRKIAIWVISLLALAILVSAILLRSRDIKKTKEKIDRINYQTNFQITELMDGKGIAIQKAKRQLGMELHDDLAASVGGLMFHVERVGLSIVNPDKKNELREIHSQLSKVYQSIRDKSHQLFEVDNPNTNGVFARQIRAIIDTALPDKLYTKEVEIDENLADELSIDHRVEILYILREATTNILKHAKASHVVLFLYKLKEHGVLHISDNGVGFHLEKASKGQSIGMWSIRERAKVMGGELELVSENSGTSIEIKFLL